MPDKIISATLKVNTGTSAADIGAVNKQLDNTTKTLDTTEEQSKQTTSSFNTLKDGLGKLPGPLGAVNQGVNTVSSSLKTLAANPIVLVVTLLVAALVALYKAFASTEEGAEKIEQILSGLGAVITVIRDRILQFAGAIVSFFKGDFKEAAEQAKASVTGFGEAAVKAYNQVANAVKNLQEAEDNRDRVTNVNRAQFERDLARSKELISDTNATYAERTKALHDVRAAQAELSKQELADAQKILVAKYQLLEADTKSSEKQKDYADAKIAYLNVQTQAAADERALNKQGIQIENDRIAKGKEADDAAKQSAAAKKKFDEEELARQKELFDHNLSIVKFDQQARDAAIAQRQKDAEDQKKQDEADQKERDDYQKNIDDQEYNNILKNIKRENDAKKKQAADEKALADFRIQTAQSVGNALGALADLVGRQTIAGKALAIAQATINTWLGVTEVLKTPTVLPEPLATINRIASITAVIAAGLSAVRNIAKTNPGSGASSDAGGISAPSLTATAPIAPTQQGTAIDQNSIAGIGNAAIGRSYVLSQDVSHDQDRNERLNRAARLGN